MTFTYVSSRKALCELRQLLNSEAIIMFTLFLLNIVFWLFRIKNHYSEDSVHKKNPSIAKNNLIRMQ